MKNKKITYLLLVVVVAVWGLIGYRIYTSVTDGDIQQTSERRGHTLDKRESVVENRHLLVNYPDPFLKGGFRSSSRVISGHWTSSYSKPVKKEGMVKNVKADVPAVKMDFIKYIGLIGNKAKSQKIGLIVVNNKEYFVKPKEVVEGVQIVKFNKDSLVVSFNKVSYIILKGQ